MLENTIKIILNSKQRLSLYIILVLVGISIWWNTTDIKIMFGNYGYLHTYTDIFLSIIIILFFPLFIIAVGYKSWKYWKRTDIYWKLGIWFIWWIAGTIISGASCCWATLAISFWLLPLLSFLPYNGLEIKIIGVLWLIYALYDIIINLETCKTKK